MRPHLLSSVQEGSEQTLIARSGCWDQQLGKVEKVYRDISPKVSESTLEARLRH